MRNLTLTFVLGLMAMAIQAQALDVHTTARLGDIPEDNPPMYTRVLVSDNDGVIYRRELSTMGDGLGNHTAAENIKTNADNTYDIGESGSAFKDIYFDGSLYVGDAQFLSAPGDRIVIGKTASATGTGSIAIGNGAEALHNNSIAIGASAVTTGENQMMIGNAFINGISTAGLIADLSDGRFKNDVEEDVPGLEFIEKLRPVSYTLDREKYHTFLTGEERPSAGSKNANDRRNGFIAQEVEQIVEENGYAFWGVKTPADEQHQSYGISYSAFVVPLTKAVQELNTLVEAQQQEIATLKAMMYGTNATKDPNTATKEGSITDNQSSLEGFALYQNVPNPFDKTTTIKAVVPETTQQARIIVYNLQGLELESYDLNQRGKVRVEISAGHFPSGMYLYALMADGQLIDTKKMVLTR